MRVLDFLKLISDINQNTFFKFEAPDGKLYNLSTFQYQIINEQPQIIFKLVDLKHHAIHKWELFYLLNKKAYMKAYLYVNWQNQPYPLFGFRIDKNQNALLG
ncbi:MAG: hypothetical protein H9901_04225 [Candidatus Paralactobacillus gallistercoris]|uniref:Uncharacterized protein n=1 Tax=Candidatus Paralactobacillus gallistercoris TaxID=2838724 RepID=A0A948TJP3_9LACO|nr:hypothetical protein [Candidatus Paralactobacillus gallistercoris]